MFVQHPPPPRLIPLQHRVVARFLEAMPGISMGSDPRGVAKINTRYSDCHDDDPAVGAYPIHPMASHPWKGACGVLVKNWVVS